jgi:hypothetical protein
MLDVDVRGENDYCSLGNFLADQPSCVEPFRRVTRRHPNVDDRELGSMLSHEREQLRRVAALADDVEPCALEQACQTFAKQDVVVRNRQPTHRN